MEVLKWFAEKVDLILLLFDAHKLDISDEMRDAVKGCSFFAKLPTHGCLYSLVVQLKHPFLREMPKAKVIIGVGSAVGSKSEAGLPT